VMSELAAVGGVGNADAGYVQTFLFYSCNSRTAGPD
jgi:hypothetical protein